MSSVASKNEARTGILMITSTTQSKLGVSSGLENWVRDPPGGRGFDVVRSFSVIQTEPKSGEKVSSV